MAAEKKALTTITYKIPVDIRHELAGQTISGGEVGHYDIGRDGKVRGNYRGGGEKMVHFRKENIFVRIAGKPDIEAQVAVIEEEERKARKEFEVNVHGLEILIAASHDEERYREEFEAMMADENNDGARPPKGVLVSYKDVALEYPRAAVYHRAERYYNARNDVKSSAGRRAMAIIASGGAIEDAEKVLAFWSKDVFLD